MLSDGFEEDVERILETSPADRQTLLFSATMPTWVKKLTRRFQKNPIMVDLVGDDNAGKMNECIKCVPALIRILQGGKALPRYPTSCKFMSNSSEWLLHWMVSHGELSWPYRLLAVQVSPESRQSVLKDVLTVYGGIGKSIIFTQTKREADAVTAAISSTHPCEVGAASCLCAHFWLTAPVQRRLVAHFSHSTTCLLDVGRMPGVLLKTLSVPYMLCVVTGAARRHCTGST